jgi:hypothetical protein
MKKRIFIGLTTCLFAIAIFFNTNSNDIIGNVSLSDIETMAQASGELNNFCPYGCTIRSGNCFCYGFYPNKPGRHSGYKIQEVTCVTS